MSKRRIRLTPTMTAALAVAERCRQLNAPCHVSNRLGWAHVTHNTAKALVDRKLATYVGALGVRIETTAAGRALLDERLIDVEATVRAIPR